MRLDKAQRILPFCGVESRDKEGTITKVWTPAMRAENPIHPNGCNAGQAKCANVTITRPDKDTLVLTCETFGVKRQDKEGKPCPALLGGYVCFHCLAALMLIGEDKFMDVKFFKEVEEAQKSVGKVYTVHAGDTFYITVTRKEEKKNDPSHGFRRKREDVRVYPSCEEERAECPEEQQKDPGQGVQGGSVPVGGSIDSPPSGEPVP